MTWLDRLLRHWRMRMAIRHLPPHARVLDIGTHDGLLFQKAGVTGVGIDPELAVAPAPDAQPALLRGFFPNDLSDLDDRQFDAATALAVVEHVPEGELPAWSQALAGLLRPKGRVVITVPSPTVDQILHVLMRLRLVAGMEAHQHHGFVPADLYQVFAAPAWRLERHRTFQLGLNHLFVFERTDAAG
jgi:2-polyprenyl-3-methyl-5-hydroxy-6-metoxy-1,4-benzoquinol methylase